MAENRRVTVNHNVRIEFDRQYRKAKDMKNLEESQKKLSELAYLEKIIGKVESFRYDSSILCQDDAFCRFYDVRAVSEKELQKHVAAAYAVLYTKNRLQPDWEYVHLARFNFADKMSVVDPVFDRECYVNIFMFVRWKVIDAECAIKAIETKLWQSRVLAGRKFSPEMWERMKNEVCMENNIGYTAQIEFSIRNRSL